MRYEYVKTKQDLTDREIAFILLANACGKVLANRDIYPRDIFMIAYRYLNTGCKCRGEYVSLVNYLIDNPDFRKELLK
jgi:hypothetical protein